MGTRTLIELDEQRLQQIIIEAVKMALTETPYNGHTEQEVMMTRTEAANFLNITPTTLIKYVNQGMVAHGGTDRKYMFRKSDLVKFMFNR